MMGSYSYNKDMNPEKIYLCNENPDGNFYYEVPQTDCNNIEYIRADIAKREQEAHKEALEIFQKNLKNIADNIPKWHKYPDEKPTEFKDYIVQDIEGNMFIPKYVPQFDRWKEYCCGKIIKWVVAWMELPEPYKEY